MPRRKRHGKSYLKRSTARRKAAVKSKKETAQNSGVSGGEKLGLDPVSNTLPTLGSVQTSLPAEIIDCSTSETSGFKYLHKKFKKVVTACPITETNNVNDGASSSSKNIFYEEIEDNSLNRIVTHSYADCKYGAVLPDIQIKLEVECSCLTEETFDTNNSSSNSVCNCVPDFSQFSSAQLQGLYVCPYCKLICAKTCVFHEHICVHSSEIPFVCLICGFSFKTKSNLNKHYRSESHIQKVRGEEAESESEEDFDDDEYGCNACHKYICKLLDYSDTEDEDNVCCTLHLSSYSTIHDSPSAPNLPLSNTVSDNISCLPSVSCQIDSSRERSKQIYNPKFHRVTLSCKTEEEENDYFFESKPTGFEEITIEASSLPCSTPLISCVPEFNVTSHSPISEYLHWQLNMFSDTSTINTDGTNLTSAQTFLQSPVVGENEKESSKSQLCSSSYSFVSHDYLPCTETAVEALNLSSTVPGKTNVSGCHFSDKQLFLSEPSADQFRSEYESPYMHTGKNIASSQKYDFLQFMQPLNLTTYNKDENKHASDEALHCHERSFSEDYARTWEDSERLSLSNQETCKESNIHCKSAPKIVKFEDVQNFTPYECKRDICTDKSLYNSQNLEDCFVKDILLNEQEGAEYSSSFDRFYSETNFLPRTTITSDAGGALFSHFASSAPNKFYNPYVLYNGDFKTFDEHNVNRCLYCPEEYRYCGCNCPSSHQNTNQTVSSYSQNKYYPSLSLEGRNDFFAFSLNEEPKTHEISEMLIKKLPSPSPLNENSRSSSLVLPSFPSPGPLLGNTPLIEGYHVSRKTKDLGKKFNEFEEEPEGLYTTKRRRIQSDLYSIETNSPNSEIKLLPFTKISNPLGPVPNLLTLEEMPKYPMRPNSLQMFGGEVQILDAAGAKKTMIIEPSLRGNKLAVSSESASDLVIKLPNNFSHKSSVINTKEEIANVGNIIESKSPQMVVTIAKSGLSSGGTIVQVSQESTCMVSTSMLSENVINTDNYTCDKIPRNIFNPRSQTMSPLENSLQKNSATSYDVETSSFQYSRAKSVFNETFSDTTEFFVPIAPNISTPSLAVPGIPAPTFGHNLPFLSLSAVQKDRPFVNPLTNITAFNPLTLQAHSALFHSVPYAAYSVDTKQSSEENETQCNICSFTAVPQERFWPQFSGCSVTVMNKGNGMPYVPCIQGPQSTNCNVPIKIAAIGETSLLPLNLANPSKDFANESFSSLCQNKNCNSEIAKKVDDLIVDLRVTKHVKSQQSSLRDESVKKFDTEPQTILSENSKYTNHQMVSCGPESKKHPFGTLPVLCEGNSSIQIEDTKSGQSKQELNNATKFSKYNITSECLTLGSHGSVVIKEEKNYKPVSLCWTSEKESNESEMKWESNKREENTSVVAKLCRPTSLPLNPETFVSKKTISSDLTTTGDVLSPEMPRPKKSFGQVYLNGHVFTFLTLKISTKPFFCILTRTQPMYTFQSPENPKLSMYSNWRIKDKTSPNPLRVSTGEELSLYDSRNRSAVYTTAKPKCGQTMLFTHSSYWYEKEHMFVDKGIQENEVKLSDTGKNTVYLNTSVLEDTLGEPAPKRLKIHYGEPESNEEDSHFRGKDHGRYACEECGMHFKKSSRLRKHMREHPNARPYSCRYCDYSFKSKRKLKKHKKTRLHYKKHVKLKIIPPQDVMDVSLPGEDFSVKQYEHQNGGHNMVSDEIYDDVDSDEDEYKKNDDVNVCEGTEDTDCHLKHEAARSLLSLSEQTFSNSVSIHPSVSSGLVPVADYSGRPKTYPYLLKIQNVGVSNERDTSCADICIQPFTAVSAQVEREKISQNTCLALEFKSQRGQENRDESKLSRLLHRRDNAAPLMLIHPQQNNGEQFYICKKSSIYKQKIFFDSKPVIEENSSIEKEYDPKMSCTSEHESGLCDQNTNLSIQMDQDSGILSSDQQPIDLSYKSTSILPDYSFKEPSPSNFALLPSFVPSTITRKSPAPITEILSPLSEPATLITSLCSSVERCPISSSFFADQSIPTPTDEKEATMLNAYLTECAVQNSRMRLRQFKDELKENNVISDFEVIPSYLSSLVTTTEPVMHKQNVENKMQVVSYMPQRQTSTSSTDEEQTIAEIANVRICDRMKAQNNGGFEISEVQELQNKTSSVACMKFPVSQTYGKPKTLSSKSETKVRNSFVQGLAFSGGSLEYSPQSNSTQIPTENEKELISPFPGPASVYTSLTEDGRRVCNICNKVFSKPSQLQLHMNIHFYERPFKCEWCAVSFRTKGHLQKHERSVSHQNKVSMNANFGTPTRTNPRPFKCNDCKIAFRIHGHLAKHLRSKMHIMRLECVGKLSLGTYAAMEREGLHNDDNDTSEAESLS